MNAVAAAAAAAAATAPSVGRSDLRSRKSQEYTASDRSVVRRHDSRRSIVAAADKCEMVSETSRF